MKNLSYLKGLIIVLCTFAFFGCNDDEEELQQTWEREVDQVTVSTSRYVDFQVAVTDSLIDVSGYVPNMGHHYLNPALVDGTFELEKPEIILYVPDENGEMDMVAVEYAIVPDDPANPGNPPEGFTGDLDEWHFNENIGQWQLHVWTILANPDGIFAPYNPVIGD